MLRLFTTLFLCFTLFFSYSQEEDALVIKSIFNNILEKSVCYDWLDEMCTTVGGRLSGSDAANEAVFFCKNKLESLGLDTVYTQSCMVPVWHRGDVEIVKYANSNITLAATSLGNSLGTGSGGLTAEVIEVKSLEDVKSLGTDAIKGKIVFYNRPMDPTQLSTFNAYGGAVDQRVYGPSVAAQYGAVGTIVRSMTLKKDRIPHTGVTVYTEDVTQIPALAISTMDADELSANLLKSPVTLYIENYCKNMGQRESFNVVGEIKGSTTPDEIILVGGHLDSWDIGQGAHDDGAGCVHAMEVMHTIKAMNFVPNRTIRCVLFMNEENGLVGGKKYAEISNNNKEYHLAAIESDSGGFTPQGFTCDGDTTHFKQMFSKFKSWEDIFSPYGLYLKKGGGGADISPLKSQKGLLIGFKPDSQRYFDYHHTRTDKIEAVNKRELELGAASITSLVYLIDKYGLSE